jgi:hypothetical protein
MSIPPRYIPSDLINEFTMNSTIDVYDWYLNETVSTPIVWDDNMMATYINALTEHNIRNNIHGIDSYYNGSLMLINGLNLIENIENKSVAVIGSQKPWIECICLNMGSKDVTTVEYNPPKCNYPNLSIISYNDFQNQEKKYDIIISYSSIEHSGLGRYGDGINPYGDLIAINDIKQKMHNDSYLLLGVPIGVDGIAWNAHRIYGKKRLPLLLDGLTQIKWIGNDSSLLDTALRGNNGETPFILCKKV